MKRRHFCTLLSFAGLSISSLRTPMEASAERRKASSKKEEQRQPFYDFSDDGYECIIHRPDTPIPWLNLLNNDRLQAWVTHQGNFECLMLDRGLNGLTNPEEQSGYIYIRDHHTRDYFVVNKPREDAPWEARQGLGYSTITTSDLALDTQVTYFVPREDNVLICLLKLRNTRARARILDVFATVEWNLGDQNKTMVLRGHGGGGDCYTGGSQFNLYKKVVLDEGALFATQQVWKTLGIKQKSWPYTGFFSSSLPLQSYDCVKSIFVGHGRTIENPIGVEQGMCSNTPFWSQNEFPWGVLHIRPTLAPNKDIKVVFIVAMVRERSDAPRILRKYSSSEIAEEELKKVKDFWHGFVQEGINVETPEKEIDRTVNIWTKYQWRSYMVRGSNSGLRGLGLWSYGLMGPKYGGAIREVIVQPHDLEIARESILLYLSLQNRDLTAGQLAVTEPLMLASDLGMEWPPEKSKGPFRFPHSHEINNIYPVAEYIKETGDFSFLDRSVPYVDGGEGTVFDHLSRGIDYSLQALTERGLARLNVGLGDWNDELNMVSKEGRGESVMMSMELCYMLKECSEVAKAYGRLEAAEVWMRKYQNIKSAVNTYAWDGQWYIRAFADGQPDLIPIGSFHNKEGKIHLEAQAWAVISGVAEGERARVCMRSVGKYLLSDFGPMLFAPAYTKFDPHVGTQSEYAPGWRNACIYPRPAGWAIMAACLADLPDLAFDMYKKTCLSERSKDAERYANEPYAYSENYNGPDHRLAGMAQYQWNLGEGANWMWHSYVYYILGIRPVLSGLLVNPKIPSAWPGFKMRRRFRNAVYEIEVANPNHLSEGIKSLRIDGKIKEGNVIPVYSDGKTHRVVAVLDA